MMMLNTQALFNLFIALVTVQQATSAVALPTRGSYGQLARRANAAKRAASAPTAQATRARLARQKEDVVVIAKRDDRAHLASPVNSSEGPHFATPSAHVIRVNPKLALKQTQVKLAATRNGTSSNVVSEDLAGGNSASAAEHGAPSSSPVAAQAGAPSPSSSSSSTWVAASNVTLPSSVSRRELEEGTATQTKQQLKKRVVAHPGEPSATIKINVVGGEVLQNFTIIETPKTATSTSIKPAQTAINVNIVDNGTGEDINEEGSDDSDATLLTFTFTLPIDAISTGNEIVTLVPAGNDAYIPYINGQEVDSESNMKATCSIPVDDDVLVAVARGQTFYSACTYSASELVSKRVRVKVDVNSPSSGFTTATTSDNEKTKRQMVAFFESPSSPSTEVSKDNQKRQMVAFFQAPSKQAKALTREEMMSDSWEDCLVGIDENCLEIPEI